MCYIIIKLQSIKRFQIVLIHSKRGMEMGTIVCQTCNGTIDHFEDEKVSVLYGKCTSCDCQVLEREMTVIQGV